MLFSTKYCWIAPKPFSSKMIVTFIRLNTDISRISLAASTYDIFISRSSLSNNTLQLKSSRFQRKTCCFNLLFGLFLGKKKDKPVRKQVCLFLVEAGGVEPPSENTSSGTSPGADGCLHSRAMTQAVMLHGLVASLVMPGAKLTPVTCTTQVTPKPGSWSFRGGRPLIKQRRELRCRCSLIYKEVPVLRWPGATARYSHFRVPVETGTPPRSRRKAAERAYVPLRICC